MADDDWTLGELELRMRMFERDYDRQVRRRDLSLLQAACNLESTWQSYLRLATGPTSEESERVYAN